MTQQRIIHPRMLSHVARFHYPNTVSVQSMTVVFDSSNEQTIVWIDDPLLLDLQAYIEPFDNRMGEMRRADQTIVENAWHIQLAGYYPTIKEEDQVTDDLGRVHNILGVDHDAFKTQTNLKTEIINAASIS